MRHSLQGKLLVSFMLVIVILLGGALWGVSVVLKDHAMISRQETLQAKGLELAATMKQVYNDKGNFADVDRLLADADSFLGARIWIVDRSQQITCMSGGMGAGPGMHHQGNHMGMHAQRAGAGLMGVGVPSMMEPLIEPALTQGTVQAKTIDQPYYGEQMQVVVVPVTLDDGTIPGAVVLMGPMSAINTYMRQIYFYLIMAGAAAVVAALIILAWLSRRLVKPLKDMQTAADAIAGGDYHIRVPVHSDDEVGRLGTSLNSLAGDLDTYMTEIEKMEMLRRDFTANVSHELRTPLTIIRGYNEALLAGAAENPAEREEYCRLIKDETLRLERLIHELLDLSRLQSANHATEQEEIPFADLVAGVMTKFHQLAAQKGITMTLEKADISPVICGNGDRLTQLVMIFLDNAIKYTPSGGQVMVKVETQAEEAVLTIADTGNGIPSEDVPYIWERFYKVDKSHRRDDSGTGLGLAIARQIIDLHNGTVTVSSEVHKGTTFTIRFPVATK